jgi:hypothetical protein
MIADRFCLCWRLIPSVLPSAGVGHCRRFSLENNSSS